jgi:hypothetical protein
MRDGDGPWRRPLPGEPGNPILGVPLISALGTLHDFEEFPGDLPPSRFDQSSMQRWGNRVQLSSDGSFKGLPQGETMVSTGDLGRSYPIDVQFRFATSDPATGQPVLPFTPIWPFLGGPENLLIRLRRVTDPTASFTETDVILQSLGSQIGSQVPFDIITSRNLGVDVQFQGGPGGEAIWIEVLATIVTNISGQDRVVGFSRSTAAGLGGFIAAVATPADELLLRALPQRVQFTIVNTSTNADLILGFGQPASWAGPSGNIILPAYVAGTHASTYESPVGGFTGEVRGSWNNAAPNGGALVNQGTYF